jgi:hypothetical protein
VTVNQHVYFTLSSRDTSSAGIAAILGLEPDETTVRGSRITAPEPIPVLHRWKIVCREPGLRVDEQIEPDQQDPPADAQDQAEAPNLFGWHLGRDVLDFLHRTGAALDIDEYDMSPDYADD